MINLKKQKWEQISEAFNKKIQTNRQTDQLIQKWRSLKKQAKKSSAQQRSEIFKTGGGPNVHREIAQDDQETLNLIQDQISPVANIFDSDKLIDVSSQSAEMVLVNQKPPKREKQEQQSFAESSHAMLQRDSMSILDMKRKEHELRMKQMAEEHELRLTYMAEEHRKKMMILDMNMAQMPANVPVTNPEQSLDDFALNYFGQ